MDDRGTINKPKEKAVADYTGPTPTSPEAAKAPKALDKQMAPPKSAGSPAPYRTTTKTTTKKSDTGLGDVGDKKLVYKPKTGGDFEPVGEYPGKSTSKEFTGKFKPIGNYPQTKTETFLSTTKDMSLSEFANYVMQQRQEGKEDEDLPMVSAYTTGRFHPHPPEAIKYVVTLADKNDRIMEDLVHAIKEREGCLKKMMSHLFDLPESHGCVTDLLGDEKDGPRRARQLVRSMDDSFSKFQSDQDGMYESVAPPFGLDDEDDEDDAPIDDEMPEDDEAPEGDEEETDGDDMGGEEDETMPEDDIDSEEKPQMGNHGGMNRPRRLKKKFAHDHLLDAMGEIEHMKAKMKAY